MGNDLIAFLDSNESGIGCSPNAVRRVAANAHTLHRYPRQLQQDVTDAVADHLGVPHDTVLLTAGVDEATDLVLGQSARACYVVPGFTGYAERAAAFGRALHPIRLDDAWEPLDALVDLNAKDAVFVAQPNNPTGNFFRRHWIDDVMRRAGLFVLDETYADFADHRPPVRLTPNALAFRSFSKSFGLAGLRVGALVGDRGLLHRLSARRRHESINSVALLALAATLEDTEYLARVARHVRRVRPQLCEVLTMSVTFCEVKQTQANFVLARCRDGLESTDVRNALALSGAFVRDCAPMGLARWVRVSVGSHDDLAILRAALESVDSTLSPK